LGVNQIKGSYILSGMFHCGLKWRGVLLVFFAIPWWSSDPAPPFLPRGTFRFGKGLLVCVLLRVDLFVHEFCGELITVINLQLGEGIRMHQLVGILLLIGIQ
jgi:hypothetical protein